MTNSTATAGYFTRLSSHSKFIREVHTSGWLIEHCGHPTAIWPYALYHKRKARGRVVVSDAGGEWVRR